MDSDYDNGHEGRRIQCNKLKMTCNQELPPKLLKCIKASILSYLHALVLTDRCTENSFQTGHTRGQIHA